MKKAAIYAISFLSLCVLLTTCYFVSYRYALHKFERNGTKEDTVKAQSDTGVRNVSSSQSSAVLPDASYVEQVYDMATDKLKEKNENIPNDFVGLTREQIITRLNVYMQNKSLEEYNKGLVSWTLESFSPSKVVVKKTYNSQGILYKYYMVLEDDQVVVYYSDKKTVYDNETGLDAGSLLEDEKRELMYGIWIKDEDELYSVLESYTS
ncbi:BofC C-terminal domain-containing protein [[Clostridium] polysaccharolyticum]|uniref:Uncharacterized protein n=1 Tax=[Clostridium] polysaccharolyticum TaxID=29364 RepID=A0A1I0AVI3_9FIRM|nr:BofC C-terminal domain-containing protein [[Clostridium] polysaccharolyticum]SES98420.1 hypothetical protein SAMN04487772_10658 [[Clostridium] polysaccharolyticum]